ncbi:MAG: universal stress protein [Leptolyngbya sp. IPPAS B-1204]|nr:universal stress protein [Elainella sp. C42_A2020_010]
MSWLKKNKVMVPIDFSEQSFAALAVAREMVEAANQLHVFHVLPMLHPTDPAVVWNTVTDESREQKVEAALQEKLTSAGYASAQINVVIGNPDREIINYAKANDIDLIVMPAHEERGLSFLFGSITEYIVRHAPCSVLVVR